MIKDLDNLLDNGISYSSYGSSNNLKVSEYIHILEIGNIEDQVYQEYRRIEKGNKKIRKPI